MERGSEEKKWEKKKKGGIGRETIALEWNENG